MPFSRLRRLDTHPPEAAARTRSLPRRLLGVALAAALALGGLIAAAGPAMASPPAPISLTSSSCPADMTQGEDDGCVTELQDLLNENRAGLTVDGDFGALTYQAVRTYQSDHALSVDGEVGPQTKASLNSAVVTPPAPSGTALQKVVGYAQAVEFGEAEPGWAGGFIQYVWAGGHKSGVGPSTGSCVGDPQSIACTDPSAVGLDCSGFARWVYSLAYGSDVLGGGTSQDMYDELTKVGSPQPGDLAFFGANSTSVDHVGIYVGNGQMINAYDTGTDVETNTVSAGGNLLGYYQY